MSAYPTLFSPFQVRWLTLRNRIVAPPMLQLRPITSPEGIAWYRRLAAGGAGMVIVEVTAAARFGFELTVENLRPLAAAIHEHGAAAGIQVFPVQFRQPITPNDVSATQIEDIVTAYGRAAVICRDAGFDAIEPHGAHGFLLNQFFMPDVNTRTDEYGGTLENRCRLALRIARRIRQSAGPDMLVFYRHTPVGKQYGIADSLELAGRLVDAGVDVLDISPAKDKVEGELAAPFKAKLKVPVIAVGGMQDPQAAERALSAGRCDLVAIGRSLIADADLPVKVRDGRESEIIECEKCDAGCFGNLKKGEPVACVLWPCDPTIA